MLALLIALFTPRIPIVTVPVGPVIAPPTLQAPPATVPRPPARLPSQISNGMVR